VTPARRPGPAAVLARLAPAIALLAALAAVSAPPARADAGEGGSPAPATPPAVRAPAAIVVEPATGDVVFGRRIAQPRPIASATKLMTALLALEREPLDRRLTVVPYAASPGESTAGLRAGERLSVADLMRALLLASANEAAQTLAVRVGGSERAFVALMNRRARALGLTDTHYATPIGLDRPGNRSSVRDLVKLTLIVRRNAFFRRTTDLRRATLRTGAHERTLTNRNTVVQRWAPANGVKTGHTAQAGYVLVGSATRAGVTVVSAVLGDPSIAARDDDSLALLRYALDRYQRITVVQAGRPIGTAAVEHRDTGVPLVAARTVRRTIRRGEPVTIRLTGIPRELEGPLPARTRIGTVELRWRGHLVDRVPLVTGAAVPAPSLLDRAGAMALRTLVLLLVAAVGLGSLSLVLHLRRRREARRPEHRPVA
jgi:D-alanyl-D-alanine carboxypeptidase (penicillin-binding protein 5/6)